MPALPLKSRHVLRKVINVLLRFSGKNSLIHLAHVGSGGVGISDHRRLLHPSPMSRGNQGNLKLLIPLTAFKYIPRGQAHQQ